MSTDNKYIEITLDKDVFIANTNPTTIAYAQNYLAVINKEIQQLPIQAFEQIIRDNPERKNFSWSENITVGKSLLNTKVKVEKDHNDGQYTNTIDGLVIFNMGKQLGHGVATLQPIKKDTIITHYAGQILGFDINNLTLNDVMSSYRMSYDTECVIDARERGNIASFVQDSPSEQELTEEYFIAPEMASKVAVANVNFVISILHGQKIVILKAARDINAGEILVASYGIYYWFKQLLICNKSRLFFTRTAEIIPAECYLYKNLRLQIKYDKAHFVELPYSGFLKAAKTQRVLRYSFVPTKGKEEFRELTLDEVKLILDESLWATVVNHPKLFLKEYIIQRLQKEYRLQKLLYPLGTPYHKFFYMEGEKLKKEQGNAEQAIAYLLQGLLLAIKEGASANTLAAISLALGTAYADKAKQIQSITCMEIAIYLLKQSIKQAPTQKSIACLRDGYDWWLQNKIHKNKKKVLVYWHKLTLKCFLLFYARNR